MMRKRDSRINVKSITVRSFRLQFFVIMVVCGIFLAIYTSQSHTHESGMYLALSIIAYIIVISFLLSLALMFFRNREIAEPLDTLQVALKKVSKGDYSVRIPPRRHDGKKDEFEVIYEDFNKMVNELENTEIFKSDFISNVSHELKTPVSIIQNYASLLKSDSLEDIDRIEYCNRIQMATQGLSQMITNILQLSYFENQEVKITKTHYNLSEQVSRCVLNFEDYMDQKRIQLNLDFDQNIMINNDYGLLDIVWNNVLSNAFKFSNKDSVVRITIYEYQKSYSVKISDDGCGISPDKIDRIFDKFYQTDESHSTKGNGLGLAMVNKIVYLLEGEIEVTSQMNKGTTIIVSFKQ